MVRLLFGRDLLCQKECGYKVNELNLYGSLCGRTYNRRILCRDWDISLIIYRPMGLYLGVCVCGEGGGGNVGDLLFGAFCE